MQKATVERPSWTTVAGGRMAITKNPSRTIRLCVAVILALAAQEVHAQQVDSFFVSVLGNDHWTGRIAAPNPSRTDGPFASLERARDALRIRHDPRGRSAIVSVGAGPWVRSSNLIIDSTAGGHRDHPVVWQGYAGADVRLVGGVRLSGWQGVDDTAILARLPSNARQSVIVAAVPSQVPLGRWSSDGHGRIDPVPPEVVWNGQVLQIARWPNAGWDQILSVDSTAGVRVKLATDRLKGWSHVYDAWVVGYWRWDWFAAFLRITDVNTQTHQLTLAGNPTYGIASGARYAIVNLPEELDCPGEYWIDARNRRVYVWPPSDPVHADVWLTALADPLITIDDASDLTFRGFSITSSRGDGLRIDRSTRVQIRDGSFESLGGRAIVITGGSGNILSNLSIRNTGAGGIAVDAGNRATLTASGDVIERVRFRTFARWVRTNAPAVSLRGVGTIVRECQISDGPHSGIILEGNDHRIEGNTFYRVLLETRDAGAIYMGRDWTARGNIISGNYFLEIGGSRPQRADDHLQAIYLDDMTSGVSVTRNVFDHARVAVLIGGGRENHVDDNVIVGSPDALYIDARGRYWRMAAQKGVKSFESSVWQTLITLLNSSHPGNSPYLERYPSLRQTLTDRPGEPIGNTLTNNVIVGRGEVSRNGVTQEMLAESRTLRIPESDTAPLGPLRMRAFLDSLARVRARPPQRLPSSSFELVQEFATSQPKQRSHDP